MKKNATPQKDFSFFITPADLRDIGMNEVGYIKSYNVKGQMAFVLHAADGTALAVQKDAPAAHISAQMQNLDVMPLH